MKQLLKKHKKIYQIWVILNIEPAGPCLDSDIKYRQCDEHGEPLYLGIRQDYTRIMCK